MTARTHDVAALSALTVWVLAVPPSQLTIGTALFALLANQLGGIAPDIDQSTAPFWRNLPVGKYFGRVFSALVGGHRFLLHSILGVALFSAAAWFGLNFVHPLMPNIDIQFVWEAFVIGMISHLLMDTLTKEGVPWLLPIPVKFGLPPIRSWRITTGKWVEHFMILPLLISLTIWLCASHYTELSVLIQHHLVQ